MTFSTVVFVAALSALVSEMVEDSLADLIYGHIFGWRNLIYALIAASLILGAIFSLLVIYSSLILVRFIPIITQGAAVALGAIGVFWLVSSVLRRGRPSEFGEKKTNEISLLAALQVVSIEELEILLMLFPMVLASHALEAATAAAIGIVVSVSLAAFLRQGFERFFAGRMKYLKIASGFFLIGLGLTLLLEM